MDVLQRVLHPLVVWNLNTTNTDALDPQATMTDSSLLSGSQHTAQPKTQNKPPT
jgi:hypothetical protein